MFVESIFKEERVEEIQRLMKTFPLASIVAHTNEGLVAEHLPLMLRDDQTLFGHMALNNALYSNPILNNQVMCIFKGDDAYISANDYPSKFIDHQKVPTWNYQVVHLYGEIEFFSDQKSKLAVLGKLTKQQEQQTNGDQAWKMADAPKDYLIQMLEHLVAFEIKISKVIAKSKLSQNKDPQDFDNVVMQLKQRGKSELAARMLALKT